MRFFRNAWGRGTYLEGTYQSMTPTGFAVFVTPMGRRRLNCPTQLWRDLKIRELGTYLHIKCTGRMKRRKGVGGWGHYKFQIEEKAQ